MTLKMSRRCFSRKCIMDMRYEHLSVFLNTLKVNKDGNERETICNILEQRNQLRYDLSPLQLNPHLDASETGSSTGKETKIVDPTVGMSNLDEFFRNEYMYMYMYKCKRNKFLSHLSKGPISILTSLLIELDLSRDTLNIGLMYGTFSRSSLPDLISKRLTCIPDTDDVKFVSLVTYSKYSHMKGIRFSPHVMSSEYYAAKVQEQLIMDQIDNRSDVGSNLTEFVTIRSTLSGTTKAMVKRHKGSVYSTFSTEILERDDRLNMLKTLETAPMTVLHRINKLTGNIIEVKRDNHYTGCTILNSGDVDLDISKGDITLIPISTQSFKDGRLVFPILQDNVYIV